jgi:hypothetical protein
MDEAPAPDLTLAGLRIWVHGRQFPDAVDAWDGNWLDVTAECTDKSAGVVIGGPILHLSELKGWCRDAERLLGTLTGEARLDCREPNLSVALRAASLGQIAMEVSITPDHLTQKHWFQFVIDQSYLPTVIAQCQSILEAYPLRGERAG